MPCLFSLTPNVSIPRGHMRQSCSHSEGLGKKTTREMSALKIAEPPHIHKQPSSSIWPTWPTWLSLPLLLTWLRASLLWNQRVFASSLATKYLGRYVINVGVGVGVGVHHCTQCDRAGRGGALSDSTSQPHCWWLIID
jgi:hypothetical protein